MPHVLAWGGQQSEPRLLSFKTFYPFRSPIFVRD